ncbi:MAG: amino acid carrier protein [Candidatus Babeliales bacterium]|nr:amino acid carrier protein [Candidatus Babeliales bacterium]
MDFLGSIQHINGLLTLPVLALVLGVCIVLAFALNFIQIRYFTYAWKQILFPSKTGESSAGKVDMTPMQAFVNTLSSNLGNGSIGGVAVGIYAGGPGAAFWIVVCGVMLMAVRFAEAFLSMHYAQTAPVTTTRNIGGPMLYLRHVVGGKYLAWTYGLITLAFGFVAGNGVQSNTISLSLKNTFGLAPIISAIIVTIFTLYIVFGGSERIVNASMKIVPVKVIVFFGTTLIVLAYHYATIGSALMLIFKSAFTPTAAMGGIFGFTVQQAIREGMMRSTFASETGLGSAGILFGFTGSKQPMNDAILAMLSTFISTIVCFIVALCIVASGVWSSGLTSTDLTIAAFQTVFGAFGGYAVSFLSVTFGIGVLVAYAYIALECWLFITGGRFALLFNILYCLFAFGGALIDVNLLWAVCDIPQTIMLSINLFGILYLVPVMRKHVLEFGKHKHA